MSAANEKGPSTASRLLGVLAILGGLAVLGGLGCAGLFFWSWRTAAVELPAVQAGALAFLEELAARRPDAAYARTAQVLQDQHSLEQFEAVMARLPALAGHTNRAILGLRLHEQPGRRTATAQVKVFGPNGEITLTLTLVPEADEWKVAVITSP